MTKKAEREARIAAKAAEKAAKAAAEKARIESNPIYAAIAPQKDAAVAHAMEFTRKQLMYFVGQFPIGSDLSANAPEANSFKQGRQNYIKTQARRSLALRVLTFAPRGYMPHEPYIVTGVSEEGIERLCNDAGDDAAASFDCYVAKLTEKVGDCERASVSGSLWQYSVLLVTKGGKAERWHTQQILNFSVYGKAFNQWPTRKMK
jgi:hypothetical protein